MEISKYTNMREIVNGVHLLIIIVYCISGINCIFESEQWNPSKDECDKKIIEYSCQATIDGNREPVDATIETVTDMIMKENDRSTTLDLLTKQNFKERSAIRKKFKEKHPKKSLFEHFRKYRIPITKYVHYNDFLWALINPVADQYAVDLSTAATSFGYSNHIKYSSIFFDILGSMSNKGLEYINQKIEEIPPYKKSLETQMRNIGQYPEEFIEIIVVLLKGDREEETDVDNGKLKDDLAKLKDNLVEVNRDVKETFLCEILTKRSVKHLRALFIQYQDTDKVENFEKIIEAKVKKQFLKIAILDLYYVAINRVDKLAWSLHHHTSHFYFTNIIVSRSEIDLKNIKDIYKKKCEGRELSERIKDLFGNSAYAQGLLNILYPPINDVPKKKSIFRLPGKFKRWINL